MVNRWYVVYFPPFVSESISFVPPNYKGIIKFLLLDIPVSNVRIQMGILCSKFFYLGKCSRKC